MNDTEYFTSGSSNDSAETRNSDRGLFVVTPNHLDMFLGLLLSRNRNVSTSMIKSLSNFLNYIDLKPYSNDIEFMGRYYLISKMLCKILKDGLGAEQSIMWIKDSVYDQVMGKAIADVKNSHEYSDEYIQVIYSFIETRLKYIYLWEQSGRLYDLLTKIRSGTIDDIDSVCEETEELLMALHQRIKRRRMMPAHAEGYSMNNEIWMQRLRHEHEMSLRPGNQVKTGLKYLNAILGGGWERSRYYLTIMETGKGKSGFGLMNALWAPMFNRGIETMDPTKSAAVVHISHENLPGQTIRRELSFIYGRDIDIRLLTQENLQEAYRIKNQLYGDPSEHDTVKYFMCYFPANTCSPEDVSNLIDDIESRNNVEVIGVVNDYSKKMRCGRKQVFDERSKLGHIVDDCKSIASLKNLFWLDFMQLRRYSIEKVEEYARTQQLGQLAHLHKTDIGESSLMVDNSDVVLIGTREFDEQGGQWMGIKSAKNRDIAPSVTGFYQPFYPNSNMRLVEDIYMDKPAGIVALDRSGANQISSSLKENPNMSSSRIKNAVPDFAGPNTQHPHRYTPERISLTG